MKPSSANPAAQSPPRASRWLRRSSSSAPSATDSFASSCEGSSLESSETADFVQRAADERSVELRLKEVLDAQEEGCGVRARVLVAEECSAPEEDEEAGAGVGLGKVEGATNATEPFFERNQPPLPPPPDQWPQRPLLLRPCPDGGTRIHSVRTSSSPPGVRRRDEDFGSTLPMNTGRESSGKCLVIDFESALFAGTAMIRIRGVTPHPPSSSDPNERCGGDGGLGYFSGRKRTFTAVVRGRFKSASIPMSRCVTGQIFRRPAGRLPPKVVVDGAVKIISHLAPQLRVDFGGRGGRGGGGPCFLSPLVSTAQTVLVDDAAHCEQEGEMSNAAEGQTGKTAPLYDGADESLEENLEEPDATDPRSAHLALLEATGRPLPRSSRTRMHRLSPRSSHTSLIRSRMKSRKRAYDRLFSTSSPTSPGPFFDTKKIYTFEFFQHLLVFDEFAVDLGSVVGRHKLARVLNGQPLKFMAAMLRGGTDGIAGGSDDGNAEEGNGWEADRERLEYLWNFDIWHECLYADAIKAEESGRL